ncbi:hypothetical protein KVR01_008194 [Diaporthe batatas]|uniref:uncharacterized protein n=1 Tax=Diaporthe batatas TaxID=748121 RepID=UPI001D051FA3|nr:uncharacterized protein KVR01_008194 [Diaporthe batatas]KAG8162429.1 hypothetical protein KVR01_008194 [Diaporthe batatas]
MTGPQGDEPPATSNGAPYPIYADFYDTSGLDCSAAGTATNEGDIAYPSGWDYAMFDVHMPYPPLSLGAARGGGESLQRQTAWNFGAPPYPARTDTTMGDTLAMADPAFEYTSVEQPAVADTVSHHAVGLQLTHGYQGWLECPQTPPMGQMSPLPSQSSHYTSSPVSGAGLNYSRDSSCSSLTTSRVPILDQTRLDARFKPVPDQALSPQEGKLPPGGPRTGADAYAGQATRQWGYLQGQTIKKITTGTTDHDAGTVSPVTTPSPGNTNTATSSQPATQNVRPPLDHRTPGTDKRKEKPLARTRQTTKQRQAEPASQAKGQAEAKPAEPTARHRNRDAANKCRAKTKKAVAELESTELAKRSEHRELSATARSLQDEVLGLKTELLAHGNCDDALIQQYLMNQARRVGQGVATAQHQRQ